MSHIQIHPKSQLAGYGDVVAATSLRRINSIRHATYNTCGERVTVQTRHTHTYDITQARDIECQYNIFALHRIVVVARTHTTRCYNHKHNRCWYVLVFPCHTINGNFPGDLKYICKSERIIIDVPTELIKRNWRVCIFFLAVTCDIGTTLVAKDKVSLVLFYHIDLTCL